MKNIPKEKVVFLSAITSDIGIALAKRYSRDGYTVVGTYRSNALLNELAGLPNLHLFYCDLNNKKTIKDSVSKFSALELRWETFISCAAWPLPLTKFFDSDFEEWSKSVDVNAIAQLCVLYSLYPFRREDLITNAVFFAGPGTNNAVKNFSALTVSKIMLIKMCELLNAENDDLNIFVVGPGWTKTKTHKFILSDPHVSDEKYKETLNFLQNQEGTSLDDIYDCIRWLCIQGKHISGGRNFSVVHDVWGKAELAKELLKDINMYKLRRHRNDWRDKGDKNYER